MLLKSFVSAGSLLCLLSACGGVPPKPEVEMCMVVVRPTLEESYCLCGPTRAEGSKVVVNVAAKKPLRYCHKATAFTPKEWEKVQNYIDELVRYGSRKCTR